MTLPQPFAMPPFAFFTLDFFLPPGVTFPEHTADAYMFAYADGYTLNLRFAAAFPLGQSLAIFLFTLTLMVT